MTGVVLLLAAVSLAACSSVKRELGVGRNSPDEFTVIKRAPLTLPPDYSLRPPSDSAVESSSAAVDQARTALLGPSSAPAVKGRAERALLVKIGADQANPDIRAIITSENEALAAQNQPAASKLIFWQDNAPKETHIPSSVVNPKAEADRLKENQMEGKPANEGDVPVIEKNPGTIDKIF